MSKATVSALGLMIATILAKILGFGREVALASAYGVSVYSDAYLIALNIPQVIFASIGAGLTTTFIPLYYEILQGKGEKQALKFTNNIMNIISILCFILIIIGLIFTKPIVKLFAIGFEGEVLRLTVYFTRVLFVGVLATGITYLLTAYLQIKERFVVVGLVSIPNNLIIILSIFLSKNIDVNILVYGTLIATISQFLFLLPFAHKEGYKYKRILNINDEYIKKMLYLVTPVFIGISVDQINVLIDKTLASTLVEGSISALNYANRLNGFVMGVFVFTITTVMYPILSKLASENNKKEFNDSVKKTLNIMMLVVTPIAVGSMTLSEPIIKILLQRGSFDYEATQMTSIALFYFSIGMIGFGLNNVLSRVYYALKDTKTSMINSLIIVIINIVLNLIMVRYLAHGGLALATSIASLIGTVFYFITLTKKIGDFGQKQIFIVFIKVLTSAIIMGVIVKFAYNFISYNLGNGTIFEIVSLGSSVFLGAIIYAMAIKLFKVEEVTLFVDMIKSKLKKK